ncbi:MAG: hypothetical protein GX851_02465 [Clostridiales bacterium]|nr:hypothetical protein [Clostridiales bacterium]
MSEKFFLGVDGGGTNTKAVVSDENGFVRACENGDSINFYSMGYEKAQRNMTDILDRLKSKLGIDTFESAAIGVSALFGRADEYDIKRFFNGTLRSAHIIMDSDLFIALEAMDIPGACAVTISGTGSMVIARDEYGKISTKGGWGYILGDEGSGYSIALHGIKSAIRGFEGAGSPTVLSDLLLDFAEIDSLPKILEVFYDPPMERKKIAAFARHVYLAAKTVTRSRWLSRVTRQDCLRKPVLRCLRISAARFPSAYTAEFLKTTTYSLMSLKKLCARRTRKSQSF